MEYVQLNEEGVLPAIRNLGPFKVVLAVEDPVSPERQHQVSEWLVAMGGMYVMICGSDCESWQDSIRRANLERVPLERMQPEEFVMITTHPHERLRGIYKFASKHARHTHVSMDTVLTVHVARQNREVEYQNLFNKR